MSTPFYDLASLVVVPSGYKASKVYAQKPLTTDGQLAFSRSTGATRVASSGLIQKVRTNHLLNTGTFTGWALEGGTISGGFADPEGGTSAYKYIQSSGGLYSTVSFTDTLPKTMSVYLKSVDGTSYNVTLGDGATAGTIATVTNTWQRFHCTYTSGSSRMALYVYGIGNAGGVLLWHPQGEISDFGPTAYIPTTSAAVSVGPVANVPRLDYLGSTCPKLLLEPQRTNLLTYSESFDNAAWIKTEVTVTANNTTGPDGYLSADKIIPTAANASHYADRTGIAVSSNGLASVFVKKGEYQRFAIRSYFSGGFAIFDVNTGVIVNSTAVTAKIENYGNGWYRCSINDTVNANYGYQIFVLQNTSTSLNSFTGNGIDGIFVWGAQLEVGAYATSYIPTLGAAVTRLADACSKTGISSLIGQTEGTLFVEFFYNEQNNTPSGSDKSVCRLKTGAGYTDEICITYYGNEGGSYGKTIQAFIVVGGAAQAVLKTTQTMVSGYYKVAVAYKANDFAMAVNGAIVSTDNSGSVPTCADLTFNESTRVQSDSSPKKALLFKTRLTNAQLAELTTL